MKAVLEVAVHFESFRNVDLFHQGLYHLRARLRRDGDPQDERLQASPHGHLALPSSDPGDAGRLQHHNLMPAHIIESQSTFSTRSFMIRYCDEEVEVNDIGQFRLEVEDIDAVDVDDFCLLLDVDLMFADPTASRETGLVSGGEQAGDEAAPNIDYTEFKCVSSQVLRVRGAHRGLHEFCPVVFDEYHFCLGTLAVHSVLLDFRARRGCRNACGLGEAGPLRPVRHTSSGKPPQPGGDIDAPTATIGGPVPRRQVPQLGSRTWGHKLAAYRIGALGGRQIEMLAASQKQLSEWLQRIRGTCLTPDLHKLLHGPIELPEAKAPSESSDSVSTTSTEGGSVDMQKTMKPITEAGRNADATRLTYEVNLLSCRILEAWYEMLNLCLLVPRDVVALLRLPWERRVAKQWSLSVTRDPLRVNMLSEETKICAGHGDLAESLRTSIAKELPQMSVLEDSAQIPAADQRPIIFEQRCKSATGNGSAPQAAHGRADQTAPKDYAGVHLFVLVHGFQGNSFDMRLMKNNISLVHPDAVFLSSSCNEDSTEGDISEMGMRLGQEVSNFINDWCPNALGLLSFLAHSMGGLIVRAALPHLTEYREKMCTFLTFSSPHLGLPQDKMSLFNTGFWVLRQWRKSHFLQQISMTDHSDPRETYLYKLSQQRGLEHFEHVVLMSCFEDQYGPLHSVRGEVSNDWGSPVYSEMCQNLWGPVKPERLIRLDVNYLIPENNLDKFIGRAAHIQFLENQHMMRTLVHAFSYLFR